MPSATKRILLVILSLIVITGAVTLGYLFYFPAPSVTINQTVITVEIARTAHEHARGLAKQDSLKDDQGMLFIFPDKQIRNFWMKDMRFALDIIWIRDNTIVGIEKNVPVSTITPPTVYQSPEAINYVLEINADLSDRHGIMVGDMVEFNL